MKVLSDRLSSLTFTTVVLAALVLWLTWGTLMAASATYVDRFGLMNSRLVRDWLLAPEGGSGLLKFWFVGLCFMMALLGVNLIFCSWEKILRAMRVKFSKSKLLILAIHVVFGLVALGHFGSFMLGYRYERVVLGEGESFNFRDGYGLRVERVHFVDNPAVLRQSPRYLRAGEFHYRRNFADIVLNRNGSEISRDRVYILKPARHQGVQITLSRFTPPKGMKGAGREGTPRVVFVVTKNPVLTAFLVTYGAMITGMIVYLAMTWRKSVFKSNN
jgi:hypothetical protein